MNILFLSHTPMGGPFVVGSHHLARGMARLGHRVAHLSPPVTLAHLLRLGSPFERERMKRWIRGGAFIDEVLDLIPASPLPWAATRLLGDPGEIYGTLARGSVTRLLARHRMNRPELVLIDEPRLYFVARRFDAARIIYRPTDLYAAIRRDDSIVEVERRLCRLAHGFVATSEPVAAHLRRLGADRVRIVENGVDLAAFGAQYDLDVEAELPPVPRAVYVGAMDRRFGFDALRQAAANNPGVSFVLIGPCEDSVRAGFAAHPNVHLLGAREYHRIPSYLRRAQLALLPLSDDPSNDGRSPMKLYEYAAAGLPVVASRSAEMARRDLPFVRLAASPGEFSGMVRQALESAFDPASARRHAEAHSWPAKCREIIGYAMATGVADAA